MRGRGPDDHRPPLNAVAVPRGSWDEKARIACTVHLDGVAADFNELVCAAAPLLPPSPGGRFTDMVECKMAVETAL